MAFHYASTQGRSAALRRGRLSNLDWRLVSRDTLVRTSAIYRGQSELCFWRPPNRISLLAEQAVGNRPLTGFGDFGFGNEF
jgi:hypothetical protein